MRATTHLKSLVPLTFALLLFAGPVVSAGKESMPTFQQQLDEAFEALDRGNTDKVIEIMQEKGMTIVTIDSISRLYREWLNRNHQVMPSPLGLDGITRIMNSVSQIKSDSIGNYQPSGAFPQEIMDKYMGNNDVQTLKQNNAELQQKVDRITRNLLILLLILVIALSAIAYMVRMRFRKLQETVSEQQVMKEEHHEEITEIVHEDTSQSQNSRNLYYTEQILNLVSDFKRLKKAPHTLTEAEIAELMQNVNQYFDAYTDRLKDMVPTLTDGDLELCALIKLGFSIKDISVILNIDSASVSTRKYRMQKRITEAIGSFGVSKDMDIWLRAF